jgi:GNAT superfamily N-acetyltransferase
MRALETLFYLEMRSPCELLPAALESDNLTLVEETTRAAVRAITLEIGQPYDWPSQHWNDEKWAEYFATANLRHWIAKRGNELIGLACVRFDADQIELDTFGLVPRYIGQGLGGPLLTAVVQLAWREAPNARRLWLHTSSEDHPAARPNYERRGFRLYRTVDPASHQAGSGPCGRDE